MHQTTRIADAVILTWAYLCLMHSAYT